MTIREAVVDDAAAMSVVQARSWRVAYRGIAPDSFLDGLGDDVWVDRWVRSLRAPQDPGTHHLVATADEAVVSVAACGLSRDRVATATGELYLVYTDPGHWGEGHGSALLDEVHRRLQADGHSSAMLWVAAENARSINFYRGRGWELEGTNKQDMINGVPFAEALMVRDLP